MHVSEGVCFARMDVEIRHLRALTALSEQPSITQAARGLQMSQPALSRTLRQLEQILQVRLFERSTHHIALTATGRDFATRARRVLAELDAAVAASSGDRSLRIAFNWLLPDPWARTTIKTFTSRTAATVSPTRTDDPITSVLTGSADLAVVRDIRGPENTTAHRLFQEARIALVADDSPLADRNQIHAEELRDHTVALNTVSGSSIPQYWHTEGAPARIETYAAFDEWLERIATSQVVGVAPTTLAQRTHHSGIRFIPLHGAPPVDVFLIHRTHPSTPLLRTFVEIATEGTTETAVSANA
jgi:DNA-binding transcriptional LysR family regulator